MISLSFIVFFIGFVLIIFALAVPAWRLHIWALGFGVLVAFLGVGMRVWAGI